MLKTKTTISEIMTTQPLTLKEDDTIQSIIDIFEKNSFDHIPITSENGLVGMVSKSDLYRRILKLTSRTSGKTYTENVLSHALISEIMTKNPVRVLPEHNLVFASEILLQDEFHAIPVTNKQNEVVGIVTAKDILNSIIDNHEGILQQGSV